MFIITMPASFNVGDTIECKINAAPERVTYRDELTLVIEPNGERTEPEIHQIGAVYGAGRDSNGVQVARFVCPETIVTDPAELQDIDELRARVELLHDREVT